MNKLNLKDIKLGKANLDILEFPEFYIKEESKEKKIKVIDLNNKRKDISTKLW